MDYMEKIRQVFEESIEVKKKCVETLSQEIKSAVELTVDCYRKGGKVIVFGNGGSAADAQHLVGELVGRFAMERKALPAIALTTNTSTISAVANDYSYDEIFSRQIEGLGSKNDVAIGISTSGTAKNVLNAIVKAKQIGMKTIGLAGKDGGQLAVECDICIVAPSKSTPRIQEVHITIIHLMCEIIEKEIFGK